MPGYKLAPSADKDIEAIVRYTLKKWGKDQNDRYIASLIECFEQIAAGKIVDRSLNGTNKNLFFVRCGHHYIFYLRNQNPVVIVRVLHERMDLVQQIKDV
ncbi:MAG: type II toxin-antitoxin system RelE/ParE family toxin [Verrucomicrobiota bacterium]